MTSTEKHIDDVLLDDAQVMAICGIGTKMTLARRRAQHGLPAPSRYVGNRGFTWRSELMAWIDGLPTKSPIAGRRIPSKPGEVAQRVNAA